MAFFVQSKRSNLRAVRSYVVQNSLIPADTGAQRGLSEQVSWQASSLPTSWKTPHISLQPVKNLPAAQETRVRFLRQEDPLVKEMATHSSILAFRIP